MRNPCYFLLAVLALASLAAAELACPGGTTASETKQGNTRILSCLDPQGRPHGPFEVWAYPDTSRSGIGVRIVEGRFSQGKQVGDWTTYGQDGRAVGTSRFEEGRKVEGEDAAN